MVHRSVEESAVGWGALAELALMRQLEGTVDCREEMELGHRWVEGHHQ